MRRRSTLVSTAVVLALLAMLAVGLFAPAAFAASKYRPAVKSVSPIGSTESGGVTVTVTGKYFKLDGKNVVTAVTFAGKAATHIRVKSATMIKVLAPAGEGMAHVRVTTTKGRSECSAADRFTYYDPPTQMSLNAGDAQTASAGAAVAIDPSVLVQDAQGDPVGGVHVTFAVATGAGSVTGADAVSNGSGIATVDSWKLGAVAGANSLTATCEGLTGSPVTFTATGDAGILTVDLAGVRAYNLAELQALTPFAGWAGYINSKGAVIGPDAITGVKVTDVVADALGTPLAATQSVVVADRVDTPTYEKTLTYDALVNLTGFTFYSTSDLVNPVGSYTGPMATVLIYSDPTGAVMPAASGPLRFAVADRTNENVVFKPANLSVSKVNVLDVIPTP